MSDVSLASGQFPLGPNEHHTFCNGAVEELTFQTRPVSVISMVVGAGIDLIEVTRIRRVMEDPKIGLRFRDRVYTGAEICYCEDKGRGRYESYAGRFAAKEAVMKAMGSGWGRQVGWRDIEILPIPGGKPEVTLSDKASTLASTLGIIRFSLSITHTKQHAMAYVIAESG